MGGRFRLQSMTGERVVAAEDFFLGPYTTARRSDEILTEVEFPNRPTTESFVIKEIARLRLEFPWPVSLSHSLGEMSPTSARR